MIKRKIYKTLSIVTIIINLYLSYLIASLTHEGLTLTPVILIIVYLVESLLQVFISLFLMGNKIKEPTDLIFTNLGFLTFRFKRIYYSDLGYFWCWRKSDNKVIVYKQSYFYMKRLFNIRYNGDNDVLGIRIKDELEEIYIEELKKKRESDSFKNWNGYIDKISERDDKLNDLGI
jgi:hypothetical protein